MTIKDLNENFINTYITPKVEKKGQDVGNDHKVRKVQRNKLDRITFREMLETEEEY